jgi:hypothetical protein
MGMVRMAIMSTPAETRAGSPLVSDRLTAGTSGQDGAAEHPGEAGRGQDVGDGHRGNPERIPQPGQVRRLTAGFHPDPGGRDQGERAAQPADQPPPRAWQPAGGEEQEHVDGQQREERHPQDQLSPANVRRGRQAVTGGRRQTVLKGSVGRPEQDRGGREQPANRVVRAARREQRAHGAEGDREHAVEAAKAEVPGRHRGGPVQDHEREAGRRDREGSGGKQHPSPAPRPTCDRTAPGDSRPFHTHDPRR